MLNFESFHLCNVFPLCNKDRITKLLSFERVNLTCLFFFKFPNMLNVNFCIEKIKCFLHSPMVIQLVFHA